MNAEPRHAALPVSPMETNRCAPAENPNLVAARELAVASYKIFPAGLDKKPLVRWREKATDDLDQIEAWWEKWPDAVPALPTGETNGITVLDLDRKNGKDGFEELRKIGLNPEKLGCVRVQTPSGGQHIYFRFEPGIRNSAGKLGPGIDVRGEGGYVIAPGAVSDSGTYRSLADDLTYQRLGLTAWPEELVARPRSAEPKAPAEHQPASDHDSTWAQERLTDECTKLRATEPGGRNHALNAAAYKLGRIAAVGLLDRREVEFHLLGACAGNGLLKDDGRTACLNTISSGFETGLGQPRYPPIDPLVAFEKLRDIDEIIADLVRPSGAESGTSGGLTLLTPAECAALPPRDYVIKGLISQSQIGCVFGDPGAGKSLIGPAMGYAVAQGRAAFGMRTNKGEVFYVAAEDAAGMQGRVAALRLENGDADSFKLVPGISDLFSPDTPDLRALLDSVNKLRPTLIVIDTLAMAFAGMDENTSEAMGRVVAVSRALARHGAAVILIHHGTKAEGNTPRGHSLFNGALDMALHLKPKNQFGIVQGKLTKNRNGSCDLDIAFTIGTRELGIDHDGDTITAAFAHELPAGSGSNVVRLSPSAKAAKDVLTSLIEGKRLVALDDWRRACVTGRSVSGAENEESRAKAFKRALEKLCREKVISVEEGFVRWEVPIVKEFEGADDGSERDLV